MSNDDVIKWKHFQRYWPFVRGIHRSPVVSLHKGQWRGALMFSLICAWTNSWVNNRDTGNLRRHRAHYDVTVMGALQQATRGRDSHCENVIYIHINGVKLEMGVNPSQLVAHQKHGIIRYIILHFSSCVDVIDVVIIFTVCEWVNTRGWISES